MINMAYSEEEKKDMASESVISDRPKYPYGLKLQIDSDMMKKLGLSPDMKIGDKVMVMAHAEICHLAKEDYFGDTPEVECSLQITDMMVKKPEAEKSAESVIYGNPKV